MPRFTVRRRVDAYVNYTTEIEADTAAAAAQIASESDGELDWEEDGTTQFDARLFITLDEQGWEIEETEIRDLWRRILVMRTAAWAHGQIGASGPGRVKDGPSGAAAPRRALRARPARDPAPKQTRHHDPKGRAASALRIE